jgi:hypothetical protein
MNSIACWNPNSSNVTLKRQVQVIMPKEMMSTHFINRVHDVVHAHSQKLELEPTTLIPHSFFVAWNGVLCLVFDWISTSISR